MSLLDFGPWIITENMLTAALPTDWPEKYCSNLPI